MTGTEQWGRGRRRRAAPFRALAEQLREELATGRWSVGSRLPTTTELAATYGLGVNTVRRAIEQLAEEGLVQTRRGSGARVMALPPSTAPSRAVGLIVPMNRHYDPVIDSVENVLRDAGVNLWLSCTDYDPAVELERARSFVSEGVEGLLIVPTIHLNADPYAHLDSFMDLGVPYVLVERRPVDPPLGAACRHASYVSSDIVAGVRDAIGHLRDLGRSRIGYHGLPGTPHSAEVFAGYQQALGELDLPVIPQATMHREPWSELDMADYAALTAELELDAIFCSSDRNAAFLLGHLRQAGLEVPGDVAVVTFNDIVADMAEVPLTTVDPARAEVGAVATQMLLRAIEAGGAAAVTRSLVSPRLIVRSSSASAETGERLALPAHRSRS